MEGDLLIECGNHPAAINSMLAAHYIFDIHYNPKVNDVQLFLQEEMFRLHDPHAKKLSTFLSVVAGIDCYVESVTHDIASWVYLLY